MGVALAIVMVAPLAAVAAYPAYEFVDTWGGPGTGPGLFDWPTGTAEGPYGEVFVADHRNDRVQVFDPDGTFLRQFGESGSGDGQLNAPIGIFVTDDGTVFIADAGNNRVSVWDADCTYRDSFGELGSGDGQFSAPNDVAMGPDGLLYVTEYQNHRVQVLEPDGSYITKWGSRGSGADQIDGPVAVGVAADGRVWVSDTANKRVQVFEPDGTHFMTVGSAGSGDGEFERPHQIKFDPHGSVYIADGLNYRWQKFTPAGVFVTTAGTFGFGYGELSIPWSALPARDRHVLVTDRDNHRIQRFFSAVPTKHEPVAGDNRFLTAIKASQEAYPGQLSEDPEGFKTVVIATGMNWPDALGGSALAGVLDAPILLTATGSLSDAVGVEIVRLGATRAIILGGTSAVSAAVEAQLAALPGVTAVDRIGGANRYVTADMIAGTVVEVAGADWDDMAFVATGANFPDALAAAPIAAASGWPIYLAPTTGLLPGTMAAMLTHGVADVTVLGGESVVTEGTEAQLAAAFGGDSVSRVWGADRYATAVEVAVWGTSAANMNWTYAAIATGRGFPDALSGGPMQGRDRSVMLLTRGIGALEPVVASAIGYNRDSIWTVRFLGGTAVLDPAVRDQASGILH